jgi:hypothetical protein
MSDLRHNVLCGGLQRSLEDVKVIRRRGSPTIALRVPKMAQQCLPEWGQRLG